MSGLGCIVMQRVGRACPAGYEGYGMPGSDTPEVHTSLRGAPERVAAVRGRTKRV